MPGEGWGTFLGGGVGGGGGDASGVFKAWWKKPVFAQVLGCDVKKNKEGGLI